MINTSNRSTIGGYLVGFYMMSVPSFSYDETMHLTFIPQGIGAMVVFYAIYDIFRNGKSNLGNSTILYGLFTVWTTFTFLLSNDFTYGESMVTLIKITIISLGCAQLIKNEHDLLNAAFLYNLSVVLVFYFNHDLILNLQRATSLKDDERFAGTLTNANIAGMYAISMIWAGLTVFISSHVATYRKLMMVPTTIIALWIVIFSGSKKALIGLVLFSLFIGWLMIQKNKHSFIRMFFASIAAVVLLIGCGLYVYNSPFFDRMLIMINGDQHSTAHRIYLINTALDVWLDSGANFLTGVGLGNFKDMNLLGKYSHSTLTETLVSCGIIGFLLYFASLTVLLFKFMKLRGLSYGTAYFTSISFCMIHIALFYFFNSAAVMYDSREFWPLMAMMCSFGDFVTRDLKSNSEFLNEEPDSNQNIEYANENIALY